MLPGFLDSWHMKTARLLAMCTGCLYPPVEIKDTTIIKTSFFFPNGNESEAKWKWWENESEVRWRWWGNESEVKWKWWESEVRWRCLGNESEVMWRWWGNCAVLHHPMPLLPASLITDKNSDEFPSNDVMPVTYHSSSSI